eukprot:TRINITY_DN55213_c0_g1_i1.p1 TRINITY_DN55213_c0_g1~~TRINITY_DN55213_c0_g1_i1.p1  ORF type:complete len:575 (-),score=47.91 TRINITY_DN55213_c0_g1_i1:81-1805(-)
MGRKSRNEANRSEHSVRARKGSSLKPTLGEDEHVILFYDSKHGVKFPEFTKSYSQDPGYSYTLPAFAWHEGLPSAVQCESSEKAIALTKAAMMGDIDTFHRIVNVRDLDECRALGRKIHNVDRQRWNACLEDVAFEATKQKFEASDALRKLLLSTGDKLLGEANPQDCTWSIGLSVTDDRSLVPELWCGRNLLGYALMQARSHLRGELRVSRTVQPLDREFKSMKSASAYLQQMGTPIVQLQQQLHVSESETFLRPISDLGSVRDCYERYGVVGVTGVLSPEECQRVIADGIEPFLPEGCLLGDPSTFELADRAVNRFGVIGKSSLFSKPILEARLHPNVIAAYVAVHGRQDVFACHDRAAWMRPSLINPCWDTPFSWPGLHFDISPLHYFDEGARPLVDQFLEGIDFASGNFTAENNAKHISMGRTVQGVLNLIDNSEEDGGFHCVPGMFGSRLKEWVENHDSLPAPEVNGRYNFVSFGQDADLGRRSVRIPCPAGTLLLFDATLPHGTRPNVSLNSRAVLFLRYLTSDELPPKAWEQRNAALRSVVSKLGFQPDAQQERHLYCFARQDDSVA